MRNDFYSGYLMHHGIQGQKWGVRNGPPYPLDASQKSSAEKKERSGLTDNQKKILKTVAIVGGTAALAYAGYKFTHSPHVHALMKTALYGNKKKRTAEIDKLISDMGPEIVKKPKMDTNLQFFSDRKSRHTKLTPLRKEDYPPDANPGEAISDALLYKQDKVKAGEIFIYRNGDYRYTMRGDGKGYGVTVLDIEQIPDTKTGLFERDPYKNGK